MEMTKEWIRNYNHKCAEFHGWIYDSNMSEAADEAYYYDYRDAKCKHTGHYISDMLFHSDWNSIMEVVEKIGSLGVTFKINTQWNPFSECNYTQVSVTKVKGELSKDRKAMYNSVNVYEKNSETLRSKKEAVIQSIDQFIDWYNKQKEL
jgi:hypothetical protein